MIFIWTFVWHRSTILRYCWWPFWISSTRTLYLHTDWRRANHAFAGNQEIAIAATRIEQSPSNRTACIRYATRLLPLWISGLIPFPLCCCFPEMFGLNPLGRCIKGSCCDCLQSVFKATRPVAFFYSSRLVHHVTICYKQATSHPTPGCVAWQL